MQRVDPVIRQFGTGVLRQFVAVDLSCSGSQM